MARRHVDAVVSSPEEKRNQDGTAVSREDGDVRSVGPVATVIRHMQVTPRAASG